MNEKGKRLELRVGSAVVLSLLVLFLGLLWLKQYALIRHGYRLEVNFPQVGGLSPGDPVMINGVKEGMVKGVRLDPTGGALVTMQINSEVKLNQGTNFVVGNIGLMGEKFVSVSPGTTSLPLDIDGSLKGEYHPGFSEILSELEGVLHGIRLALDSLRDGEKVSQTLTAIHNLSSELDALIGGNKDRITATIADLREGGREFRRVMGEGGGVGTALADLSRTSQKLEHLVERLEETSASLRRISSKVEAGEGSLGRLVNDENLYVELRETIQNLNDLIYDIKENPRRYFRLKLF